MENENKTSQLPSRQMKKDITKEDIINPSPSPTIQAINPEPAPNKIPATADKQRVKENCTSKNLISNNALQTVSNAVITATYEILCDAVFLIKIGEKASF